MNRITNLDIDDIITTAVAETYEECAAICDRGVASWATPTELADEIRALAKRAAKRRTK